MNSSHVDTTRNIERYQEGIRKEEKYLPENQKRLKNRMFTTYDTLLRHRGRSGLVAGASLLDLGSADGSFVAVCRDNGLEARGLDIVDNINFEHDPFPVEDESVDVVTASSVLEHLYQPANLLEETLRVLKPGGALIMVCPNWRYSTKIFFDDPTHVHPYSPVSLRRLLDNYGFAGTYIVPWLVMKPTWMWDLPKPFFCARWLIPFRGNAPAWIPGFLKGRSASLLSLALKPE